MAKIVQHSGISEDYNYEWEEYVLVGDDGEELIAKWGTQADCPEDNGVGRLSVPVIQVAKVAGELGIVDFEYEYHEDSRGYLDK